MDALINAAIETVTMLLTNKIMKITMETNYSQHAMQKIVVAFPAPMLQ